MSGARLLRASVWCSAAFGLGAFAIASHAAEQCMQNQCDEAKHEVERLDNLADQTRMLHLNQIKALLADPLDSRRADFFAHLKALKDFSSKLDGIDKEVSAPDQNLQIDKLVTAIDGAIKARKDLDEAMLTRKSSADDNKIIAANDMYIVALDQLYAVSNNILNPAGGADFYTEAERYVEAQKLKYSGSALKYEQLQKIEEETARKTRGVGALKDLNTFAIFLGKDVGQLVAKIGKEPRTQLDCNKWIKDPQTGNLTQPSEMAQAVICARLKLEEAKKKKDEICKPCPDPKSQPSQAGTGVKIVSVTYGKFYKGAQSCDATNYFRETCEMIPRDVEYCYKNNTLSSDTANCEAASKFKQTEYAQRSGGTLLNICKVDINPRRMCSGYVPDESGERQALIQYKCSETANAEVQVWQVWPPKRDKETAYLICPDANRPSEYRSAQLSAPAGR